MSKISLEQTSTRPDLQIVARIPGAYIIKNNTYIPDLNDDAMVKREEERLKKDQPIAPSADEVQKPSAEQSRNAEDVKGKTEEKTD